MVGIYQINMEIKMKNKILFIPISTSGDLKNNFNLKKPEPAKNFLPTWWKEQELTVKNENKEDFIPPQLSFKGCMPFLDSLTAGYMLSTHQDIYVSKQNNTHFFNWNIGPDPMTIRDGGKVLTTLPTPDGCSEVHYAWRANFGILLPKGYSMLITHPFNRNDLPFISSSGIIDEGVPWPGQFSFWIKKDFTGLIPQGTPIAQIIPFKRENWNSELRVDLIEQTQNKRIERDKHFFGFYKKFIRQEKKFQ